MNISDKKTKKNVILVAVFVIIFLGAGITAGYLWWLILTKQLSENINPEIATSPEISKTVSGNNDVDAAQSPSNNDGKTVYSPASQNAATVQPNITFARETDGKISLGSFFSKPANGECKLILSKSGEADIVKTAPIRIEAQYICQFWDIIVPSSGGWSASLTNVNGSSESSADVRIVEVL